nr:DUF5107 domain-containing protein [uncultured Acetatifactor sp.]
MNPELRFEKKMVRAADLGPQSCVPDLLGELILQNHLTFRLDEDDEIYEGYGRRGNAYPYRQHNGYIRELCEKQVQTAVLENQYLRAVFLTEYGGRLWELWDRESGRNLLYTNDVIRFSNLAVRNAWFSGGVEWNIGIIGHNPFTTQPLYVSKTQDHLGNPVLRMYEYERIRGTTYQMDFWLEEGSRRLNCRMRIVNESAEVIPMYWWSNIAVPEYNGGRVIVPAQNAFTYGEGMVYKVGLPEVNGIDVSNYKQIPKSVDYFFDIPEESPKYIANVDETGYGLLQMSTKRLRSRKLFSWGNQDASDRWQEFLTEGAGRYVEIQAGLGKTQYGCIPMAPHTAWEWMEQYGPVQIPGEVLRGTYAERSAFLTERIIREGSWEAMEETLKRTKGMARRKAQLVFSGSGYGALAGMGPRTEHLEFLIKEESLKKWQEFFKTSVLHCPPPLEEPDEFLINEKNLKALSENMEGRNGDNWYAHYHLGLGYYAAGEYGRAKEELKKSLELEENPWALHGLSCIEILAGNGKGAARRIEKGMELKRRDKAYLKEGFKILSLSGEYEALCRFYDSLDDEMKRVSRIKFYYISALHKNGKDKEAFELLEEGEGLEMEDIREGEDSIALLWSELQQSLFEEPEPVPHRYRFKAY